jgi:flagellar FliL protein
MLLTPRMSEATAAGAAAAPAAASNGRSSKKLVILLVVLNVVTLGAGGGYVFWMTTQKAAADAATSSGNGRGSAPTTAGERGEGERGATRAGAEATDDDRPDEEDPIYRGQVIALDPIITNIGASDEGHFLKVTVQLEVRTDEAKARVDAASVPIRDAIIAYLSSLSPVDTEGETKKREIKERLRQLVNAEVQGNPVRRVYFTDFLVQ